MVLINIMIWDHRQQQNLERILKLSLAEDLPNTDITSEHFLMSNSRCQADIVAKESGIFYGERVISTLFKLFDIPVKIHFFKYDGDIFESQDKIASVICPIKVILQAERVLLNFIQHLSGVATITRTYVNKLNNPNISIMDTRKTTPVQRFLEREAVVAGGGKNHRLNLSDMVLLKENHLSQIAKEGKSEVFGEMIRSFKEDNPSIKVEVEVESPNQLRDLDLKSADIIMLDNFELSDIDYALTICEEKNYSADIEISGNINLENISNYANLNIQRISIGRLTHSVRSIDLSLLTL